MTHKLFVYGTLLDPDIQLAVMGRTVSGQPDLLPGYRKTLLEQDGHTYPDLTPDPENSVPGQILKVTDDELARLDHYEGEPYKRVRITLTSGAEAWVYYT